MGIKKYKHVHLGPAHHQKLATLSGVEGRKLIGELEFLIDRRMAELNINSYLTAELERERANQPAA